MEDTQITQETAIVDSHEGTTLKVDVLPDGYMDSVRKTIDGGEVVFSVVDVIGRLLGKDSHEARKDWNDVKRRCKKLGIQLSENFRQLKLVSKDSRLRATDCANLEGMLRIIQEVPSPKAEPIKRWLAQVGVERIAEEANPDLIHERWAYRYRVQGKTEDWIKERSNGKLNRYVFTDTLKDHGIEGKQYGFITAGVHRTWSGKNPSQDKKDKGLKKNASLRDAMSRTELALSSLAESAATEMIELRNSQGYKEVYDASIVGAGAAKVAREALEKALGRSVITVKKALEPGE